MGADTNKSMHKQKTVERGENDGEVPRSKHSPQSLMKNDKKRGKVNDVKWKYSEWQEAKYGQVI